ncbi:hypothetical protein GE061_016251 [Apolygus lucorum]|uniref:Uncharacterized protein n=1 Tax=Apolygus lucorum TaxID=248454 RepID=A0A6A4K721_APOLU|nr:hypothetical protein GE061_016251 [Apolygus lucorum]
MQVTIRLPIVEKAPLLLFMSGDAGEDEREIIQKILNGTNDDAELSSLAHVDAPNEGMYMLCGVVGAMVLVAIIIVLLALTISKLRKREDGSVVTNNNNNINNNNTVIEAEVRSPPPVPAAPLEPPPFLWRYSASSQFSLSNTDQTTLVQSLPCEEISECKGFRKNLRGKWRRLVKKKPQPEVYTIPAEFKDQLKQIYVY